MLQFNRITGISLIYTPFSSRSSSSTIFAPFSLHYHFTVTLLLGHLKTFIYSISSILLSFLPSTHCQHLLLFLSSLTHTTHAISAATGTRWNAIAQHTVLAWNTVAHLAGGSGTAARSDGHQRENGQNCEEERSESTT